MIKTITKAAEDRMNKTIDAVKQQLASIRTGKASPSLVENLKVNYYGSMTPMSQVASISAPEPRLLVVQLWDKTAVPEVVKTIQSSDLGLNPQVEGQILRIPIPPLSEERRRELVKLAKKYGEEAKVALRNIRRDVNDELKKTEKEKKISEDQMHDGLQDVQKLIDDFTKNVDHLTSKREAEVMEL
ncbi:MAG: ribosome recycling factor [candidate division Zixibacteria bacterium]|nr:ribosome recycling factor [candidate division Zixibacteria bacterium]MBU1470773.1 ribosome recycling factor [candidate division Zixibacteria bacterium]MBU2625296.1 ribosome recycling factor [candidate division Zixibacteria bacterium]